MTEIYKSYKEIPTGSNIEIVSESNYDIFTDKVKTYQDKGYTIQSINYDSTKYVGVVWKPTDEVSYILDEVIYGLSKVASLVFELNKFIFK